MAARDLINKLQGLLLDTDPRHSDHDILTAALARIVKMDQQLTAIERQFAIDYEGLTETANPS